MRHAVTIERRWNAGGRADRDLEIGGVPRWASAAVGSWNGGVAGAIVLLSCVFVGKRYAVAVLAAAALLFAHRYPVPVLGGQPWLAAGAGRGRGSSPPCCSCGAKTDAVTRGAPRRTRITAARVSARGAVGAASPEAFTPPGALFAPPLPRGRRLAVPLANGLFSTRTALTAWPNNWQRALRACGETGDVGSIEQARKDPGKHDFSPTSC